jgi:RNA polymerase sigma factor (TIGR02999 family)
MGENPQTTHDVTRRLHAWRDGDPEAPSELFERVYRELRRRAAAYLRGERRGHTLQPTALVAEAFLRLSERRQVDWQDRNHFFAVAAQAMRRVLIDHARRQRAGHRIGAHRKAPLTVAEGLATAEPPDVLDLDRALDALARRDRRQARLVELRFFAGLSVREAAQALGVAPATAVRDWLMAKAFLRRELAADDG